MNLIEQKLLELKHGEHFRCGAHFIPNILKNAEPTNLGFSKSDSIRQLRSIENIHIHEYPNNIYELHRDKFDPRNNPLEHLMETFCYLLQ